MGTFVNRGIRSDALGTLQPMYVKFTLASPPTTREQLLIDERKRIVRDLGPDGLCIFPRNHIAPTVGRSVGEAFSSMYMP